MSARGRRTMRVVTAITAALLLAYVGFVPLLSLLQRKLLYFPSRSDEAREIRAMGRVGLEPIRSVHGDVLAYRAPVEAPEARLIVAHGNAGAATDRLGFVRLAADRSPRFEVWLVEYPGYGSRAGEPSERANVQAILEAIDRAKELGRPVFLLGESLGSAVVSLAAAERKDDVQGVILVTPLPRVASVARHHYPFVPTSWIVDRYEADTALERFGGRVAFVVAGEDDVIPTPLGLAMYEGYRGPKLLEVDATAAHDTVDYTPSLARWKRVFDFVTATR